MPEIKKTASVAAFSLSIFESLISQRVSLHSSGFLESEICSLSMIHLGSKKQFD